MSEPTAVKTAPVKTAKVVRRPRQPHIDYGPLMLATSDLLKGSATGKLQFSDIKRNLKLPEHVARRLMLKMLNGKLVRRTSTGYVVMPPPALSTNGGGSKKPLVVKPVVKRSNGNGKIIGPEAAHALELTIDRADRSISMAVEGMQIKIRIAS